MKHALLATSAMVFALSFADPGHAEEGTLTVAAYGGSFEQTMRKEIIPGFEAKGGVKIVYVAGNSTDTLAKLQAQKSNQQIDVIIVDDGPAYQAVALGFCADLASADVYKDVYDNVKFKSNKAIGIGLGATGLMYNKKAFDENKWPAPTSWNDLSDPKYRKKLVIPPLNNTYGLHTLVMVARQGGGGETNIDPGFTAFKEKIGPNVLVYEPSPAKMTELFQSGQALIAVWGWSRERALADTGFPSAFVFPKEGGVTLGVAACPVAGSKNDREAQAFVQYLLSPEAQLVLAKDAGFGPVNKTVQLPPEVQKNIPYGDAVKLLNTINWDVVNPVRDEWNKRWTHEIER